MCKLEFIIASRSDPARQNSWILILNLDKKGQRQRQGLIEEIRSVIVEFIIALRLALIKHVYLTGPGVDRGNPLCKLEFIIASRSDLARQNSLIIIPNLDKKCLFVGVRS